MHIALFNQFNLLNLLNLFSFFIAPSQQRAVVIPENALYHIPITMLFFNTLPISPRQTVFVSKGL
jgi:hypothetical protein